MNETGGRELTLESFQKELDHSVDIGVLTRIDMHNGTEKYACAMAPEIIFNSVQARTDGLFLRIGADPV